MAVLAKKVYMLSGMRYYLDGRIVHQLRCQTTPVTPECYKRQRGLSILPVSLRAWRTVGSRGDALRLERRVKKAKRDKKESVLIGGLPESG